MTQMLFSDCVTFVLELLRNPVGVGSIAPSSRRLAALMTREITATTIPVIELGSGTGVFTRQLLAKGVSPESLTLIENGQEFVQVLMRRFPTARICCIDACDLKEVIELKAGKTRVVVSGLPMSAMSSNKIRCVLKTAFWQLEPHGAFYQFTYWPRCPVSESLLSDLGLRSSYLGMTFLNIPPAFVYRIESLPVHCVSVEPSA